MQYKDSIADNVIDKDSNANILGLKWNTSTDTLTFTSKEILSTDKSVISKRKVLQCSSRLYDPLHLLAPVTIQAKLFMQELWQLKLSWDEPLSKPLSNRWHQTAQEIQNSTKMVFPRRYFPSSTTKSFHYMYLLMQVSEHMVLLPIFATTTDHLWQWQEHG